MEMEPELPTTMNTLTMNMKVKKTCVVLFAQYVQLKPSIKIAIWKMITLLEQYLIDCDHNNKGYTFGDPRKALSYILEKEGVVYKDSDYKLRGGAGKCECSKYKPAATIDGYAKITHVHDEDELKKAVKRQPVTSSIDIRYLENYKGGILDFDPTLGLDSVRPPPTPGKIPRHGFVIVGFGRENGIDYWK